MQIRPCISAYLLATHSTQLNYGNIERREDTCRARMKPDVVSKPAAFQTKVVILLIEPGRIDFPEEAFALSAEEREIPVCMGERIADLAEAVERPA